MKELPIQHVTFLIFTVIPSNGHVITLMFGGCKEFNSNSLGLLYCSFILTYFNDCTKVLRKAYSTHTEPLFLSQERADRIIYKKGCKGQTNNLFAKSHLLEFLDLI